MEAYLCPECESSDTEEESLLPGTWCCNGCGNRFDLDNLDEDAIWHPGEDF